MNKTTKTILGVLGFLIIVTVLVSLFLASLQNNPPDGEYVGGQEQKQAVEELFAVAPITKDLPYRDLLFSIDYGKSQTRDNAIVIYITTETEANQFIALDWITKKGYNPADYEIVYEINPALTRRFLNPGEVEGD
jgi:hypothetical protein